MIKTPKNKLRVISVGDVHGFDTWKQALNYWRPEEEETLIDQFDYIIFIGDYVDDFDHTDEQIYKNLLEIIELKEKYPHKVILLWGNHEMHYLFGPTQHKCSGYRTSMYLRLNTLLNEKRDLFQLAFQIKNYLWTHAGVHRGWYADNIERQTYVIRKGQECEWLEIDKSGTIADTLNFCFEAQHQPIYDCSFYRSGRAKVGGPLWADFIETYRKPILNYHQIIGHTRRSQIDTYTNYKGDTSTTYVDCMSIEYNNYHILEIDETN